MTPLSGFASEQRLRPEEFYNAGVYLQRWTTSGPRCQSLSVSVQDKTANPARAKKCEQNSEKPAIGKFCRLSDGNYFHQSFPLKKHCILLNTAVIQTNICKIHS